MTHDEDVRAEAILADSAAVRMVRAVLEIGAAAWAQSWTRRAVIVPAAGRTAYWSLVAVVAIAVVMIASRL